MRASERFMFSLMVFASLSVFPPPKVCAQNETSCISNYAELKRALFDNDTGNMERLLYTFSPTNSPTPHYVWVYYFHNESAEWENVLACPSSSNLGRCPTIEDGTKRGTSYHVIFWGDSPLLINMDIPLLKFLSYNSILHYLDKSSCVQLVIPPFCSFLDEQKVIDMLKFATSYLQAYSISTKESNRDYVLHCDEKYEVEFECDAFLVTSEVIICLGSVIFFAFVGFKLCSVKGEIAGTMVSRIRSCMFTRCQCGNVEAVSGESVTEAVSDHGPPEQLSASQDASQDTSVSQIDSRSKIKRSVINTYKGRISVLMIINLATVFSLIVDTSIIIQHTDVIKYTFLYGYGVINFILFVLAFISILAKMPILYIYIVFIIICCADIIKRRSTQGLHKNHALLSRILDVKTTLTFAPFLYLLSRLFVILLAFATYPQDVGLVLLAIGSGVVAFLFVVWAAIHITADSREKQVKWWDIFISLMPYWTLLFILGGFLLSYILVILRMHINPVDPVTSLISALFPGLIAFVAGREYEKHRQFIKATGVDTKDDTGQPESQQSFKGTDSSSEKKIEGTELQPSTLSRTEPLEAAVKATGVDTKDATGQPKSQQSFKCTDSSSEKKIEGIELQPSTLSRMGPLEVDVVAEHST